MAEIVPCPFPEQEPCAVFRVEGECYTDEHHLFYPKAEYKGTRIEREFRQLPENRVEICRNLHNIEHAIFPEPEKPSFDVMKSIVFEERQRRKGYDDNR